MNKAYGYDAIGNLETLSRYGFLGGPNCDACIIDELTYTYDEDRAQLIGITDGAPLPGRDKGFKPKPGAGAYQYDANGNMIFDPHKDLTISYNFLNLPAQIAKSGAGSGTLSLTYDALGRKWRKQGAGEIRDYINGIEYKDGKVESIQAPEGRLTAIYDEYGVSLTHYRAEYWHRDHLGNTRLAFSDENHDGAIDIYDNPYTPGNESEIVQENHYYPFGLNHEGLWYGTIGPRNKYQYNGKELNEDFGLHWYDYGARWQDPAAGRWWAVDALAEKYASISPYAYVANNPIKMIDPNGRYIVPAAFAEKYKMIAKYLQSNIKADVMGNERILSAMRTESQGNLTREKVQEAVTDGLGPTITYRDDKIGGTIDAEGVYEKSTNQIQLRGASLDKIEAILRSEASEEVKQKALLPLLMTVTHETVHYGDYLDGSKYDAGYEIGDEYEQRVWLGSVYIDPDTGEEHLIHGIFINREEELQHAYENNPDTLPTVPKKDE